MVARPQPVEPRLLTRLAVDDRGCWIWTGYVNPDGYAYMSVQGRHTPVHRVAYELANGPIPDGLVIDHLCRVRHCANPRHLEPVTAAENTARGESPSAQHARQTACRYGHPFTTENTGRGPRGSRRCLTCHRERERARRRRAAA